MVSALSCYRGRPCMHRSDMRELSSLGLALPFADQVQPQFDTISGQLRQTQDAINATNRVLIQGTAAGIDMADEPQQNNQAQQKLTDAPTQFTPLYPSVYATFPPSLSAPTQLPFLP